MSVEQQTTSLTTEQATEQVKAWIVAGLPGGFIHHLPHTQVGSPQRLSVIVDNRCDVDAWATALGAVAEQGERTYGLANWPRPVALPGWALDVWTYALPQAEPIRIEVLP